jgi:hypothetical protein
VSPGNAAQVTWVRGGSVNFTWTASFYCGGDADYCNTNDTVEIKVASDPGLSANVVLDQYVGVCFPDCPTSYSAPFSQPGTYYWQVSVRGHDTVTPSSGVWSFTLVPAPPQIASFAPAGGGPGTAVTLTGTGFTGATAVKFNGAGAQYSVVSDTEISTSVPSGATNGPISVTAPGGTSTSSSSFVVSTSGKPVLKAVFATKGGPRAGSNFTVLLEVVDSKTGKTSTGGRVVCNAKIGTTLLVPISGKFVSELDGYACIWRLPPLSAGQRLKALVSVIFKASDTTVSNQPYKALVRQATGEKLVLIGPPAHPSVVAGENFQASQSARLQLPNGSQKPISWTASGTSASCGGSLPGKVELFSTGIRCTWLIPLSARGRSLVFVMTIHALGQTKRVQFSARAS